jgi:TfoX/Sxy family transcriptional regulator of competence genes
MAYDEVLAGRVRTALAGCRDVREQRMFGGLCFMVSGHMTVGLVGDRLMLRLGEDRTDVALSEPHVSPMDFTGRPMTTMVYVEPAGIVDDAALGGWIARATEYTGTLPPKAPKRRA